MAGIEVEGMDELLSKLGNMSNKVSNVITKTALEASAIPVLEDAKSTSVFADRSGRLRDGLKIGKIKTKNGEKYIEIGIGKEDVSEIFYGKFIEWGASNQATRPFLQPALEKNRNKIKEIITAKLKEGLGL
ncbi:HK97-gp10 family putative phage morphogenesis protein [Clostridium estertheticum]|uniref:HK97-gp10 family putative phage morphogenesis protein n=1 Tax=Clostridium estertheticum TaxID=238834 RepID=UPI001CF4935C|nr:HK97-gp10 family putative phage morphogenesis protein [Clostridium estertheticum]MCB2354341.1 HK97 gp10 family phage protein [Clostridium estertheticum]WAG42540.1 HK97 gp10 family phage protein [Clostridium estertheticum]